MVRLVRHALRQLRGNPGFALTAILTLALGIGSATAIFAALDAVLLEPLPFHQPDRLVALAAQPDDAVSIPTMQDYQSRSTTFASFAAYRPWSPIQTPTNGMTAGRVLVVSQGFFSTLGAAFELGRSWPVTGNEADCSPQAVVSGGYWRRLGGGGSLGGTSLHLDGREFQIAGVLPMDQAIEGSYALNRPEVFLQIGCDRQERPQSRGSNAFQLIGRLRPGVSIAQASADLARVDHGLQKDYPAVYGADRAGFTRSIRVFPYIELLVGSRTKPSLLMTLAACGLLLLIACANLANLLLARNTRRRGEFATRATLGATMGQLLKQLLAESAVLVVLGAAGGTALARVALDVLKHSTALHLPRLTHAALHPLVLGFVVAVSALVTFLLALLPARRTLRRSLVEDLQGGWAQLCRTPSSRGASARRRPALTLACPDGLLRLDGGWRVCTVAPATWLHAGSSADGRGAARL